jgi:hypothetical protein
MGGSKSKIILNKENIMSDTGLIWLCAETTADLWLGNKNF